MIDTRIRHTGCTLEKRAGSEGRGFPRRRRVVAKAEVLPRGPNPRFVVTSLSAGDHSAQPLYEQIYCARGEMENRIKEQQLDLFADRTSTRSFRANQLRLLMTSFAYVLVEGLRRGALQSTCLARATVGSIRLKLLKIGAQATLSVRRIKVSMASGCPCQKEFRLAWDHLLPWGVLNRPSLLSLKSPPPVLAAEVSLLSGEMPLKSLREAQKPPLLAFAYRSSRQP